MTYLKTTSISMALAAVLGATSAFAGETPPSFAELDADANGQVSFSEFATQAEANGKSLTSAQRQFNVISGGAQSFTADQYESSFTVKGDIKAGETDSLVVMPSESTAVKGAVESNEALETSPQVKDEKTLDNETIENDAMEPDTLDEPVMDEPAIDEPAMDEPAIDEPAMEQMDSETSMDTDINSTADPVVEPMLDTETKMETDVETNTALDTETTLDNEVMSDTETTIDSPQLEDPDLNIDPTEEVVQPESDTSYDTEFTLPDVPEKPVLDDAETDVGNEMDSEIEVEDNQELNKPELNLDIKSDIETDLKENPGEE